MGIVYLIHFEVPYHHAKHYLGFCEDNNLASRMERHKSGNGSKLIRAVEKANIKWSLVKVWENQSRSFERVLKNKKNSCKLCPCCINKRKLDG